MNKTWLFATTNKGKLEEVREYLTPLGIELLGISDLQIKKNITSTPQVIEDGSSYMENAKLKAEVLFQWSKGVPTLADDSGLEVVALNNLPGLHTARYAGEGATAAENINKLLKAMDGVGDRRAEFICALYLKLNDNDFITAEGKLKGEITLTESGNGGFGYDPILIPHGYNVTLAEMKGQPNPVKTHRILAIEDLLSKLSN